MKIIFIILVTLTLSISAKVLGVKDFFQMTTGTTLMPTILPTYVTVQYNAPYPGKKRKQFISDNFDALKEDIAKGEGEYLETLAILFLVKEKEEWKGYLQSHFQDIYEKSQDEVPKYIEMLTYGESYFPLELKNTHIGTG
jgi:hypothetical protein